MSQPEYKALLGFSDRWFELGLLTGAGLCALGHEYETSDDQSSEHYRYRAFRDYLASHRPLSPQMSEAIYELGAEDPDAALGGDMQRTIVELPECPASVLDKAVASGDTHLIKVVRRKRLLAELASGLTAELFARCLTDHDEVVQRELLTKSELSRNHLEQLAGRGANRAVRNMAQAQLRFRRDLA